MSTIQPKNTIPTKMGVRSVSHKAIYLSFFSFLGYTYNLDDILVQLNELKTFFKIFFF